MVSVAGSTVFYFFALKRVPITGRLQLDLVTRWKAAQLAKSQREEEANQVIPMLMPFSMDKQDPCWQQVDEIFNRLIHASGLGDRDWDLRLVVKLREYTPTFIRL